MEQLTFDAQIRNNRMDLQYFIAMQESQPADKPDHSAEKWDQRAEAWETERIHDRKGDERICSTVEFLQGRGLLQPAYEIADIGCGPGRFAVEFAKRVQGVTGLDISEKMVQHGREHVQRAGLGNVRLCVCDFQTLDVERAGLKGAFDLVFSSLTPAIHGMNGLEKSMAMSRAYCCNITHLSYDNQLYTRLMAELFDRKPPQRWTERWFYSLCNVLFLLGYCPELSYEYREQEQRICPDEAYVQLLMEHLLTPAEHNRENREKIWRWIRSHLDGDGLLPQHSSTCYGRTVWDVRRQTERRDYRLLKE